LVRACLDLLRRHRRNAIVAPDRRDPGPSVGDASGEVVLHDALERAFRRLSPEHRAVVVLTHLDELSTREAAALLEIPLGTVKSRLHHALRALRAALEADSRLPTRSEVEPA
jgi:RNA polymerase sigma factor (sigma-70 family)